MFGTGEFLQSVPPRGSHFEATQDLSSVATHAGRRAHPPSSLRWLGGDFSCTLIFVVAMTFLLKQLPTLILQGKEHVRAPMTQCAIIADHI